jgi:hypothetical protein
VTPYAAAQTPSLLPKGMKDAQDPHLRILLQPKTKNSSKLGRN